MSASDIVYVIGFPKSGNTWLTRLVADATGRLVRDRIMRDSPEIAADINQQLSRSESSAGSVAKVHFMPGAFTAEVETRPSRIVYVHRDIRDVLVSAYFYFRPTARNPPSMEGTFGHSWEDSERADWDEEFWGFAEDFLRFGIKGQEAIFGTWSSHVNAWRAFMLSGQVPYHATVSYEALSVDPVGTMLDTLSALQIGKHSRSSVEAAVERQSFANVREIAERSGDSLRFGKEFNLRFLRRGKVGDWQHYFSPRNVSRFPPEVLATMETLNYL